MEEKVLVPATTLDAFLNGAGLEKGNLALWIDVEGAADSVIRGARDALARTLLIRVEVEWWTEWQGQWLGYEIKSLIESHGFHCVADSFVADTYSQSDLLFVRSNLLSLVK